MAKQNSSKFLLYLMDGSPTAVPKLIAEQINMTISRSTNTIDVTSKTNGGYEEFIGGLKSGEVSGELIMDADIVDDANTVSSNTMSAIEISRTVRTYQAKLVSASKTFVTQFNGLITKFDIGAPLEDKITVSFTIKRSGAPTETVTPNA